MYTSRRTKFAASQVGFSTPEPDILTPLNYAIDIIFVLDICFNYRTSYFDRTATLVGMTGGMAL